MQTPGPRLTFPPSHIPTFLSRPAILYASVLHDRGPLPAAEHANMPLFLGRRTIALCGGLILAFLPGCIGSSTPTGGRASDANRQFPLDRLETASIRVDGREIRVWIADEPAKQNEGLMFVPENELPENQGMLFVFPQEDHRGFWMLNTITPLDIAYARADGTIVSTYRMEPLGLITYPSIEPAMFALEMKAGEFARLGVEPGDKLTIPQEIITRAATR
jgi:uncharacterized membrane protein (UPF0127 family)